MPKIGLDPYWTTTDGNLVRIYNGDVLETLKELPSQSIHCCVTSPPYWGLRSYLDSEHADKHRELGSERIPDCLGWARGENCAEKDWGSACHVCRMVLVFRELRRVLRDDGILWVNYGDTYSSGTRSDNRTPEERSKSSTLGPKRNGLGGNNAAHKSVSFTPYKVDYGLPSGNLCGVPWKVAFALQADGWVLRSDIIWHKVSAMPESVRNRCSKAHEYVFMFAKKMGYYYDSEAIKDPSNYPDDNRKARQKKEDYIDRAVNDVISTINPNGAKTYPTRNKRSVWSISSQGYEGAHFATFPVKLIEPMILAGTSERGACASCGSPWKRILETNYIPHGENAKSQRKTNGANNTRENKEVAGNIRPQEMTHGRATREDKTIGWRPSCECYGKIVKRRVKVKGQAVNEETNIPNGWNLNPGSHGGSNGYAKPGVAVEDKSEQRKRAKELENKEREETIEEYISDLPLEDHPIVPCTVCDPFLGSGTTCCVAIAHGRRSVGIELSETYIKENAIKRVEGALMDRPQLAALAGRKIEKIKSKGSLLK